MKKKILCLVLALVLVVSFAACGGKKGDDTNKDTTKTEAPAVEIKDSADLLNQVYMKFTEDQQFPVMGGDPEGEPSMDGAGLYPVEKVEGITFATHITEENLALADQVATMMHAMNANTFTAASYHLKDAKTAQAFADSLKESVKSTQWMCGFPDSLIIYTVNNDYIVAVFGANDILTPFKANMTAIFGDNASLIVEESLIAE